jgi:hypothetical protein
MSVRFTIRDLLWLMVVGGLTLGWWRFWHSLPEPDGPIQGVGCVAGKPIVSGRAFLHSTEGQFRGAEIANGFFLIERVPIGKYRLIFEGDNVPPNKFEIEINDNRKAIGGTFDIRPTPQMISN